MRQGDHVLEADSSVHSRTGNIYVQWLCPVVTVQSASAVIHCCSTIRRSWLSVRHTSTSASTPAAVEEHDWLTQATASAAYTSGSVLKARTHSSLRGRRSPPTNGKAYRPATRNLSAG